MGPSYKKTLAGPWLGGVRSVACDSPSPKLYQELCEVMPNLQFLALDLSHLCFLFEAAQGRAKTEAGALLRVMQAKWHKVHDDMCLPPLGAPLRLSARAVAWRGCIRDCDMDVAEATDRLAALDGAVPYKDVMSYVGDVAALCAVHYGAVSKRPHKGGSPMYDALWRATAPERLDYARNNQRRLLALPQARREQLASGTTGVEALNAEINNHFRFYGSMYQSTLLLTIRAFGLFKLLAHNSAEYCPTLAQRAQRTVMVHMACAFGLSDAEWGSVAGTGTPLASLRAEHRRRLRGAMDAADPSQRRRRGQVLPGVRKRPAGAVKRHTFNKKRVST